ncbi:hypothetical protein LTR42_002269 [Elasticomyces elasticus]|nr:hypothetical protein LTR42_002269 [Elasticomyces elasticus]
MIKTYEGNCHCGNIKYTVTLPEALAPEGSGEICRCNCSICTKNGYYLVYPKRADVHFLDDSESKLKAYFFGKKNKPHRFCPECSSSILIDFANSDLEGQREHLAMNASLFKGIDLENAKLDKFNGMAELDPQYEV